MTELQNCMKKWSYPDAAVNAFAAGMEAKYSRQPTLATAFDRWVQCDWTIEYQKVPDKTGLAILAIFLLVSGNFSIPVSERNFSTYHRMTAKEAADLRRSMHLRRALLPLVTFGTVLLGLIFLFIVVGSICFLPTAHVPITAQNLVRLGGIIFGSFVLFLGAIKLQMFLRLTGRPPHTTEFADQRIKLDQVRDV